MSHQPHLAYEQALWARGFDALAGVDEAGRGAWAGPVVAAAVVFPARLSGIPAPLLPVRDSKLLSSQQRERCFPAICAQALAWGVGIVSAAEIDADGILPCTRRAMHLALRQLSVSPQHLLIDALRLPDWSLPQQAIIRGDRVCLSIAAASILAKVTRDRLMRSLDASWPGYGLAVHKGYGTAAHREALQTKGPSPEHRRSYAPIRALLGCG